MFFGFGHMVCSDLFIPTEKCLVWKKELIGYSKIKIVQYLQTLSLFLYVSIHADFFW